MSTNSLFSQPIPNNYRTVSGIVTPSQDDTVLYCDTSSGAVVINLLAIPNNYWNTNAKLYVVDNSNNASVNNITINAGVGQTIDNQNSISIAINGGSVCVRVSGNTRYSTTGGSNTIPSLTIPVNNTVYVMKNGSDVTGKVERFDLPFLTIAAAISAATTYFISRDENNRVKIVVESGYYTETSFILHKFIDFDLGNSVITLTDTFITDSGIDFGITASGILTNIIYGSAKISSTIAAMYIYGINTKVLMYVDSIGGSVGDGILVANGYLRIFANRIYSTDTTLNYTQAINILGGSVVEVYDADIYTPTSGKQGAIEFNGGTSLSDCGQLTLVNCRVCCRTNTTAPFNAAINVGATQANDFGILTLNNTIIYSQYGNCINVDNTGTLSLYCYGVNAANTAINTEVGGVLNTYIGTILVDANVTYNNLP